MKDLLNSLVAGGYLFLGDAETIHVFPDITRELMHVPSGNSIIYKENWSTIVITAESSQALQSPDEDVRLQALLKLDVPNTDEETEKLVAILADQSWRVRKAAVQILAKTDINLVVPFLMKALSVGNIGLQNVRFHNSALECLTEIGRPTIPYLTVSLKNPDKDVRIAAAQRPGHNQASWTPAMR